MYFYVKLISALQFYSIVLSAVSASENQDVFTVFPRLPISVTTSKNSACRKDSEMYLNELKNMTMWATRMWDATAKSIDGVLVGNLHHLGDFHECIETKAPFTTQYCLVTIVLHVRDNYSDKILERFIVNENRCRIKKNFVQVAWCIPASCSAEDAQKFLMEYLENSNTSLSDKGVTYSATVSEQDCQIHETIKFDSLDITFCILTALLLILVIAATIIDYYIENPSPILGFRLLLAFSARKNLLAILNPEQSADNLSVLNGIRTIACTITIIAHRFGAVLIAAFIKNLDKLENVLYGNFSLWKISLYHADVNVDTFFIISGIVNAHLISRFSRNGSFQHWRLIAHRYFRTTTLYAYILFFYATFYNLSGSGPLWKHVVSSQKYLCRKNWYINLFYLQNYIQDVPGEFCMLHTWSLACDFHFFLVGLLICFFIIHKRRLGLILLFGVIITSIAATFIKVYSEQLSALPYLDVNITKRPEFDQVYIKSHLRAAPYFIGFYAGYLHDKYYNTTGRLNLIRSVTLFILSVLLLFSVLSTAGIFYDPSREYNAFESAMYAALNRVVWSVGIIGIIFIAIYGSLPVLTKILSWKMWIPFSKLSFAAYIVHFHYHVRIGAASTSSFEYNVVDLIIQGINDHVYIFVTALIFHLLVEAPFSFIFRVLLFSGKRKTSKEKVN